MAFSLTYRAIKLGVCGKKKKKRKEESFVLPAEIKDKQVVTVPSLDVHIVMLTVMRREPVC